MGKLTPDLLLELKSKGYDIISMGHAYRINGSVDIYYNGRTVYVKSKNEYTTYDKPEKQLAYALKIADQTGKTESFKKTKLRKDMSYQEFKHKTNASNAEYYHWKNNKVTSEDSLYFIQAGINVKIGRSVNPEKRIKELSTGSAEEPVLVYVVENMGHMEKKMHIAFEDWRVRQNAEWFFFSDQIKKFIEYLKLEKSKII